MVCNFGIAPLLNQSSIIMYLRDSSITNSFSPRPVVGTFLINGYSCKYSNPLKDSGTLYELFETGIIAHFPVFPSTYPNSQGIHFEREAFVETAKSNECFGHFQSGPNQLSRLFGYIGSV